MFKIYLPSIFIHTTGIYTFAAHAFSHLILNFFLLPELKQILQVGLSLARTTLWNSLSDNVQLANVITLVSLESPLFYLAAHP